ncbi:MAG: ABC transporter ATP-binding protein [Porphyromonas sp.]|nr:ABC transporter ATP-binding protein [Porphyromonas sp.]
MSEEYVVSVKDVVKDYAEHRALDHVSLQVPKGKIYGLLGPNGAGKTTLIRILNRITAPDSGEILFNGKKFTAKDLDSIGYLPEERGLYRKMKVGDQAMYLAQLKGLSHAESKARLTEWFERLDIMPWWKKKVQELSKGMAQKVQFICTVIHEPKLLIFDEPFSGFDPVNVELMKHEILSLRDKGHTIIFSTHNMQSVEELCNNITLINKSRVVLEGDVQLIRNSYKGNAYRIVFDQEVQAKESDHERYHIRKHETDDYGRTTFIIENHHSLPTHEIVSEWNSRGNLTQFEEIIPTMHEIFLDIVQQQEKDKSDE